MEYEKIKEWLDALVENNLEYKRIHAFNSDIETCMAVREYIQLYQNIEMVADCMGLPLKETKHRSGPGYSYSFVYRDIEFVEYSEERLERYVSV